MRLTALLFPTQKGSPVAHVSIVLPPFVAALLVVVAVLALIAALLGDGYREAPAALAPPLESLAAPIPHGWEPRHRRAGEDFFAYAERQMWTSQAPVYAELLQALQRAAV